MLIRRSNTPAETEDGLVTCRKCGFQPKNGCARVGTELREQPCGSSGCWGTGSGTIVRLVCEFSSAPGWVRLPWLASNLSLLRACRLEGRFELLCFCFNIEIGYHFLTHSTAAVRPRSPNTEISTTTRTTGARLRTARLPHHSSGREPRRVDHETRRSVRLPQERGHRGPAYRAGQPRRHARCYASVRMILLCQQRWFAWVVLSTAPWIGVSSTDPLLIQKRANTHGLVGVITIHCIKSGCKMIYRQPVLLLRRSNHYILKYLLPER